MLSGVYYTLARAALVAGDRPRALLNLKESIEVGMPGHDVALVARARINAQAQMPGAHLLEWGALDDLDWPNEHPGNTDTHALGVEMRV